MNQNHDSEWENHDSEWENHATVTVEELCQILGIGRRQAYEAIADGTIKSIRVGRSIRISTKYLKRILDEGEL